MGKSIRKIIELIPNYSSTETAGDEYYFDEAEAVKAINFFPKYLKFVRGEKTGKPFYLTEWQKALTANIFGWKSKKDGSRRYKQVALYISRKNGKTFYVAGLLAYLCFCGKEYGSQVASASATRKQASLIFDDMEAMINANPKLYNRSIPQPGYKRIKFDTKYKCIYQALSSEGKSAHGLDLNTLVVDELHCIEDEKYLGALTTGSLARQNYLHIFTTTVGIFKPESPCYKKYEYSKKVCEGVIDDKTFLPVIYELDEGDDYTDEKNWIKANPSLGETFPIEILRIKFKEAENLPSELANFQQLHLNMWINSIEAWIDIKKWKACSSPPSKDKNIKWIGGLDMSSTVDLSSFVLAGEDEEGYFHCHTWAFIPKEGAVARGHRDKVPYLQWATDGFIELTEGDSIDHDYIREKIKKIAEEYNIKEIAVDRYNATQIITQLQGDGFEMVPFGQGFVSMNAPAKFLETIIAKGKLRHGGHPVLNWCASNVCIETDASENIKPSKKKSTERIDCIVALCMALGRLIQEDRKEVVSVYEERGVLIF